MSFFHNVLSRIKKRDGGDSLKATDAPEHAIIVATFPRSGTTWMINSLVSLYNPVQEAEIDSWLFKKSVHELKNGHKLSFKDDKNSCFAIIKTHMNRFELEETGLNNDVIYVYRHPADVMLSYYFYTQHWIWNRQKSDVIFDAEEFSSFLRKTLPEWVAHVTSWAISNESLESGRVFLVQYEEMKTNFNKAMNNAASFVKCKRTNTITHCKESMLRQKFGHTNASFFRKGTCGDWENYFTPNHSEIIDEIAGHTLCELGYSACIK